MASKTSLMAATKSDANPIREYWEKIESGEIVVCEKIRKTYAKVINDMDNPGEWFYSEKRAEHVITFAEAYCRHSKGKWGGKKIKLELWERAHLATVFGFIDIEGNRKYRESVLIVGKKNGKSLLASIVGLYLMIADSESGPEVYAVATTRDQAKIVWTEAKRMVAKSPALKKLIKTHVADLSSEDFNSGVYKPLASDSDTLDGLNVSGALMDEIHQWKNGRALYDIIADGVSAREQPLVYITSTAGTIREDLYDQKYDEAEMAINGYGDPHGYHDERTIYFIYELDSRKEWTEPDCWIKANPGLCTIKNIRTLSERVEKAKSNPALVKNLVCKEFNIRETSSEAWLTFEQLNNDEHFDITELKPRYAIGGVDLSATTDLTCATVIFKIKDDEHVYVNQMYFIPEAVFEKKIREDKVPYDTWQERGLITICPGNKVDYHMVVKWFVDFQNEHDVYITHVGYDAWSAQYFVDEMTNTFGKGVMGAVFQGKKTLSAPMKSLGADLEANRVVYNGNPILKWCLANTAIDVDRNNNIQPCKTHTKTKRIDGMASLLDAVVELERNYEEYITMI